MQLEQEEPETGVSDGVRIKKYWKHLCRFRVLTAFQSILVFPCLSELVYPCHMGMLMSSEDSPNLVVY